MKHLFKKDESYTKEGCELNKRLNNYFKKLMKEYKDYPTIEVERIALDAISTVCIFERAYRYINKKIK